MLKVYISGQITGLSHDEYMTLFGRAEALLLDHELIPVNPLKVAACEPGDCVTSQNFKPNGELIHSWQCYLKHDIIEMLKCDSILMLPNWINSEGAHFELDVASKCGLTVAYINDDFRSWRSYD